MAFAEVPDEGPSCGDDDVDGTCLGELKKGAAKRLHRRLTALVDTDAACCIGIIRRLPDTGTLRLQARIPYEDELLQGWVNRRAEAREKRADLEGRGLYPYRPAAHP